MNEHHLELLEEGYTLVAANHRLARLLQFRYAHRQLEAGVTAWPSPDILHWQVWLRRCWERYVVERTETVLLNEWQEQILWQKIISESDWASGLMQPANVAKRVAEAWNLLQQCCIPIFPGDVRLNEDARAFKSWAAEFSRQCRINGWSDGASSLESLVNSINEALQIALIGFDRITPRQQQLITAVETAGGRVVVLDQNLIDRNETVRVIPCADSGDEITAAANWSRHLLETNADAAIGVVVPDLHSRRPDIVRRFSDCLCPGGLVDRGAHDPPPFSVSLGRPLSDYPLIDTALSLLSLEREAAAVADLGYLLRSPYLGGYEAEYLGRTLLDARLREHGEVRPSLNSVFYIASRDLEETRRPVRLLEALERARARMREFPRQASPGQWAELMTGLLSLFGWPGDRTLTSYEHQTMKAWRELLSRFVSLQLMNQRLTYSAAVNQLRRIASASGFQPETGEMPIQIIEPAGAAAMDFDHLWIMGLHEEAWPPAARANPFIPLSIQHRYELPGSTAEQVLAESKERLTQLLRSAPETMISYPENDKDRSLGPSPLIKPYMDKQEAAPVTVPVEDYAARLFAGGDMENLIDERAPPLSAGGYAAGGTALFKDQSVCPFRAFARHRLHARSLDEVDIGLSPQDRGLILHRVMQRLWQRLESQQRLNAMEDAELERLLDDVIDETLAMGRRFQPQVWTDRFTGLEKARLKNILREWLQQETRRAAFRVHTCEEEQTINIEGIATTMRIDRIDRLADGREVVIDYKSGEANVNEWLGERPEDPQLPLYAISRDAEIAAVAFGRLKRDRNFGYQGLACEEGILPATKAFASSVHARHLRSDTRPSPDWEDLFDTWRTIIAGLARDFYNGKARVDPKTPQTCQFCDLHPLCRIHELQQQDSRQDD